MCSSLGRVGPDNILDHRPSADVKEGLLFLNCMFVAFVPSSISRNSSLMRPAAFISIFSAVLITMIDVGITKPGGNSYRVWPKPVPFHSAFLSVTNIIFAYGKFVVLAMCS